LLHLALASLAAEQRQIIVLRDYMDLSYGEIAAVLGVAGGTVMSRLHRARVALAKAYREYDEQ
jgi:RNA polymerase sigma-70 factor (ECF subfamily)